MVPLKNSTFQFKKLWKDALILTLEISASHCQCQVTVPKYHSPQQEPGLEKWLISGLAHKQSRWTWNPEQEGAVPRSKEVLTEWGSELILKGLWWPVLGQFKHQKEDDRIKGKKWKFMSSQYRRRERRQMWENYNNRWIQVKNKCSILSTLCI